MGPTLTLLWGSESGRGAKSRRAKKAATAAPVPVAPGAGAAVVEVSAAALPIWLRCKEVLTALGFWDEADAFQLARYAEHYSEWQRLSAFVRKKGTHQRLISNKGKVYFQKRPECIRVEYLERTILQLERDLGLSRKSRRMLLAASAPPTEKAEESFFRQRG
jgi:P27 family predicted phage terminase small subunit